MVNLSPSCSVRFRGPPVLYGVVPFAGGYIDHCISLLNVLNRVGPYVVLGVTPNFCVSVVEFLSGLSPLTNIVDVDGPLGGLIKMPLLADQK